MVLDIENAGTLNLDYLRHGPKKFRLIDNKSNTRPRGTVVSYLDSQPTRFNSVIADNGSPTLVRIG